MAKAKARSKAMYEYLEPTGCRLIVSKPEASAHLAAKTESGIFLAETSEHLRKEHGMVCKIHKRGPLVDKEFKVGDLVLIHEFGGLPIFREGMETESWIVAESDLLARVSKDYAKASVR